MQIGLDTPTNQPDRGKVSKMTASPVPIGLAMRCFVLSPATKLDTLWMILGVAVISLIVSSLGLVALY
ncbi:MAG: hypothetical protein JO283_00995, partial [Bradyrhizobium sp.]|nr:hypothetical protein [Bradyrhizobium sp.]